MAKPIYEKDNSDLDGSTETVDRDTQGRQSEHMFHIAHDLDTTVTVTFYGTRRRDDAFNDKVQIGQVSLSSGGDADYETLTDPWEKLRLEFAYGADPTSGNIAAYENAER